MTAPRLEIDLDKIHHNATTLVDRLTRRGIAVTGVTKAVLGSPEIVGAWLRAGVTALGDSRIENVESMRRAGVPAAIRLIRSPMLSQADQAVALAEVSYNTEIDIIAKLSSAARKAGKMHGVVLMIELGDLREGIMPSDLEITVRDTLRLPNIVLRGIGTNLACRNGVTPDARNMAELSALADSIETTFDITLDIVSGGNSANLQWALSGADTGRINDLRLGESLLLGREPLHRRPIDGLHTDAITLVAEVIESKVKPTQPWGEQAQTAFGDTPVVADRDRITQTILAIGRQDIDPYGLDAPCGIEVLGASSDHLIVASDRDELAVGAEVTFQLNYSALVRAMTSPFVAKVVTVQNSHAPHTPTPTTNQSSGGRIGGKGVGRPTNALGGKFVKLPASTGDSFSEVS
jgi:predicted amino acid racemase